MSKKITIELSDKEYEDLAKAYANAKESKVMPTKALNIDDFCKEIINMFAKGPSMDQLKDLKLDDILAGLGQMKDALGGMGGDMNLEDILGGKKPEPKKDEAKKDEVPDDQKYKS